LRVLCGSGSISPLGEADGHSRIGPVSRRLHAVVSPEPGSSTVMSSGHHLWGRGASPGDAIRVSHGASLNVIFSQAAPRSIRYRVMQAPDLNLPTLPDLLARSDPPSSILSVRAACQRWVCLTPPGRSTLEASQCNGWSPLSSCRQGRARRSGDALFPRQFCTLYPDDALRESHDGLRAMTSLAQVMKGD
jgi:hypothetical protein